MIKILGDLAYPMIRSRVIENENTYEQVANAKNPLFLKYYTDMAEDVLATNKGEKSAYFCEQSEFCP